MAVLAILAYRHVSVCRISVQRSADNMAPGSPDFPMGRFLVPPGLIAVIGYDRRVRQVSTYGRARRWNCAARRRFSPSDLIARAALRATFRTRDAHLVLPWQRWTSECDLWGRHAEVVFPGSPTSKHHSYRADGLPPLIVVDSRHYRERASKANWARYGCCSTQLDQSGCCSSLQDRSIDGKRFRPAQESRRKAELGQRFSRFVFRLSRSVIAVDRRLTAESDRARQMYRSSAFALRLRVVVPFPPASRVPAPWAGRRGWNAQYHGVARSWRRDFRPSRSWARQIPLRQDRCLAITDRKLLYSDGDHLSLEGSKLLAAELGVVVNRMLPAIVKKTDTTGVHLSGSRR
jgi:hypothetical protein